MAERKPLRLNQGDPSEARVYFLPHLAAQALGLFAQQGVDVQLVWAEPGRYLAKSGQIPAVLKGDAELTVGGPMVTMRMQADGSGRLVNFCALVRKNPWFLAARSTQPNFTWQDLAGRTVLDIGAITTASLSLRWQLGRQGLSPDAVEIIEPGTSEEAAFEAFLAGHGDYVFHSLHALGPYLADGRLSIVTDLAGVTGDVPWSTYITLPETLRARAADFAAFTRAIAQIQTWVATSSPEAIVEVIAADFPGYPPAGLRAAVARYKELGIWSPTPIIPREDFERFRGILMEVGWFDKLVPYEDQVAREVATAALDGAVPIGRAP